MTATNQLGSHNEVLIDLEECMPSDGEKRCQVYHFGGRGTYIVLDLYDNVKALKFHRPRAYFTRWNSEPCPIEKLYGTIGPIPEMERLLGFNLVLKIHNSKWLADLDADGYEHYALNLESRSLQFHVLAKSVELIEQDEMASNEQLWSLIDQIRGED